MKHALRLILSLVISILSLQCLIRPTQAQEQTSTAQGQEQTGALEEIVVTAEKRAENLQLVPISATVQTGADLQAEGVYTLQQLQNQAPGLSIQPPGAQETFVNIRGVGLQQSSPNSSNGVVFYVDGVYVPSLLDTVDTFYDLANVEVLRGPQGTLVGTNSNGGAIFINSVQPSFDSIKGYIQQIVGNYSDYRTEGGINLPISDELALRMAFVHETRNSFTENVGAVNTPASPLPAAQNTPGNVDFTALRLQLAWRPLSNLQFTLRFEPYDSRTDGMAVKPFENQVPTSSPYFDPYALSIQDQPFKIDYDTQQYWHIAGQRWGLTASWYINDSVELRSITGSEDGYQQDMDDDTLSSAPGPNGPAVLPQGAYYQIRQAKLVTFTQELDLLSTGSGPFQWVAGLYYLNEKEPFYDYLVNENVPLPIVTTARHLNYAAFASGTYQFTPQWSLTLGGRYSYDDLPYLESSPCFCVLGGPSVPYDTQDHKPTGTAKLSWQARPDTLLYASVSTGYKAGGVNLQIAPAAFPGTTPPYAPETNVVEELGVKTDLLDHHLRLDADIYDSQYAHYQLQEGLKFGPIVEPYTQGPGRATIIGSEAEMTGVFNALKFNLGLAYLHAKVAGAFPYLAISGQQVTIPSGATMPYAPDWSVTSGIEYAFQVSDAGAHLTPRLQYQYQAAQYVNILNPTAGPSVPLLVTPTDPITAMPGHGTLDFLLTYGAPAHWQLQAYMTNLTNRWYIADLTGTSDGFQGAVYAPPRQFGARLNIGF